MNVQLRGALVALLLVGCGSSGSSGGGKKLVDKLGFGTSANTNVTIDFKGAKLVIPDLKDTVDGKLNVYQPSAADIAKVGFSAYVYEFAITPANTFSPVARLTITGASDSTAVISRASSYDGPWTDMPTTYASGAYGANVDGFAWYAVRTGHLSDAGMVSDGGTGGPCPGFIGSCNTVGASQCADIDSTDSAGDQSACANASGTWSSVDHCPAAMKAGGCKLNAAMIVGLPGASCKVQWYYAPLNSTSGVQLNCESFIKGVFLAP